MYKLLAFIVIAVCLASCVSTQKAEERAHARRVSQLRVVNAVSKRPIKVEVDYMMPRRVPAQHLTTNYSLTIFNDSVDSYLPYFGVAYQSNFGDGMRGPLIFTSKISNLTIAEGKKNTFRITFSAKKGNEVFDYDLLIYDNGKARIQVQGSARESIDFSGNLVLPELMRCGNDSRCTQL